MCPVESLHQAHDNCPAQRNTGRCTCRAPPASLVCRPGAGLPSGSQGKSAAPEDVQCNVAEGKRSYTSPAQPGHRPLQGESGPSAKRKPWMTTTTTRLHNLQGTSLAQQFPCNRKAPSSGISTAPVNFRVTLAWVSPAVGTGDPLGGSLPSGRRAVAATSPLADVNGFPMEQLPDSPPPVL